MSDLISRSEVLDLLYKVFEKYNMSTDKTSDLRSFGTDVFKEIKEMPTAYDIDKVVEEFEKNIRNKAIDDFSDKLSKYLGVENATKYGNKNAEQQRNSYDTLMKYEIADAIDDVAEQLKVR